MGILFFSVINKWNEFFFRIYGFSDNDQDGFFEILTTSRYNFHYKKGCFVRRLTTCGCRAERCLARSCQHRLLSGGNNTCNLPVCLKVDSMLFKERLNSKGSKNDPWGTPETTSPGWKIKLSMQTTCDWFDSYDVINLIVHCVNLKLGNICRRMRWFIESKALLISLDSRDIAGCITIQFM